MSAKDAGAPPRLRCLVPRDKGADVYIHRWMGHAFEHEYDLESRVCRCQPYYFGPDDRRSMEEIMDDIDEAEWNEAVH